MNNYEEQRIWNVEWNIELYHCSALAFTTVRLRSFYRWIKAITDIWYIGYEEYIYDECDGRAQYWVLLQFKKEISWRKRKKRNGHEYWFLLLKSQWCFVLITYMMIDSMFNSLLNSNLDWIIWKIEYFLNYKHYYIYMIKTIVIYKRINLI